MAHRDCGCPAEAGSTSRDETRGVHIDQTGERRMRSSRIVFVGQCGLAFGGL